MTVKVQGQLLDSLPVDLYIPPEALEVFLEMFEGPLDLLLYLIKKNNLDILDIPMTQITEQYLQYIEVMRSFKPALAADYLEMAAILIFIKSKMLLPRPKVEGEDEAELDPRAELVKRLQAYEQFKQAADNLDALPRQARDIFQCHVIPPIGEAETKALAQVDLTQLQDAFRSVLLRADRVSAHLISREGLSVREKMTTVLARLNESEVALGTSVEFTQLFVLKEGRLGVVVTFLALLELAKEGLLEILQSNTFSPIYVRALS